MQGNAQPAEEVGVIIGRFQTPRLHPAHHDLIKAAFARHGKVIIILGCAPIKLSKRDPLDFMSREIMLKKAYPAAVIVAAEDMPSDERWSAEIDAAIRRVVGPATARLYGSRDSFIPHYHGRYPTTELPSSREVSATQIREEEAKRVRGDEAWRVGIIYATSQRFLISYQCVDAIIWRPRCKPGWSDKGRGPVEAIEVLLGHKDTDPPGSLRFIGGFVDPADESLEAAAAREAWEETGKALTFFSCDYISSHRVQDWRYRREKDKIMTAVFTLELLSGEATAADDISALKWVELDQVGDLLVEEHRPLWPKALERLKLQKSN